MGTGEMIRGMARKGVSITASVTLSLALIPAAAFAAVAPETPDVQLDVTRAATGSVTLKKGTSYKLGAVATNGAKLCYKTSKKSVATVSSKGVVRVKKPGKAIVTVTARAGKKKAVQKITVTCVKAAKYKPVKAVSASFPQGNLRVGDSTSLNVTIGPKKASNKNVTFKSSDSSIVSVSSTGIVTGLSQGMTDVKVTSCSNKKASFTVSVEVKAVEEAKPNPTPDAGDSSNGEQDGTHPGESGGSTSGSAGGSIGDSTGGTTGGGSTSDSASSGGGTDTGSDINPDLKVDENGLMVDSDGDGYPDYVEKTYMNTDPNAADDQDTLESKITLSESTINADTAAGNLISVQFSNHMNMRFADREEPDENTNVEAIFRSAPDVEPGKILVIKPCTEAPEGAAIKVASLSQNDEGHWSAKGVVANAEDVFDYININDRLSLDWDNAVLADGCSFVEDDANEPADQFTALSNQSRGQKLKTTIAVKLGGIKGSVKSEVDAIDLKINGYRTPSEIAAAYALEGFTVNRADLKLSGELSANLEFTYKKTDQEPVTLCSIPLIGTYGEGLLFELRLEPKAEGQVGVSWKCDVDRTIRYTAKKGFENIPGKMVNPRMELTGGAKLKAGLNAELNIQVLSCRLMAAGIGGGAECTVKTIVRQNPSMTCSDVNSWFFFEVYGKLLPDSKKVELSVVWEIFNETNSPLKSGMHLENGRYAGKTCTWKPASTGTTATNPESDFTYTIKNGDCGYGAYAEYAGNGGPIVMPQKLGGVDVVWLDVNHRSISRLNIPSIDLSRCTGLRWFSCAFTNTTSLNLKNCTSLRNIDIVNVQISNLDLSSCVNLQRLYLMEFWQLKQLDVRPCKNLKELEISTCPELTSIDARGCSNLDIAIRDLITSPTVKR